MSPNIRGFSGLWAVNSHDWSYLQDNEIVAWLIPQHFLYFPHWVEAATQVEVVPASSRQIGCIDTNTTNTRLKKDQCRLCSDRVVYQNNLIFHAAGIHQEPNSIASVSVGPRIFAPMNEAFKCIGLKSRNVPRELSCHGAPP
ncbi:hypothetical protein BT63DRAFT_182534 [Microthyrium microscopicum]|uniref:C2H2-type domain-containing protein n=1 Tax=Microthyrium microscopicum TaxID=703497 RepID=A0A6A6ULU0_9PEZI|nr:hypothetical protein BT63DRAFT_182534 [Microthyrium microscopicum]